MFADMNILLNFNIINTRFLRFRLRRIRNVALGIPLPYMPVVLALVGLGFIALWSIMQSGWGSLIVGAFFAMILLGYHAQRKDYRMVCLAAHNPWPVFAADYLMPAIPLSAIAALRGHWATAAGVVVAAVLIGMIKPARKKVAGFPVPRFIPVEAYEIRSGIRRNGGWILGLYVLACATVWLPFVPLFFLWFNLFVMADFYRDSESTAILCSAEQSAARLLRRKLRFAATCWLLTIAPVCIVSAAINPAEWGITVGFALLSTLNACMFPLAKYARYVPNEQKALPIVVNLSIIGAAIPLLAPVTPALLVRYHQLSVRNLKIYLDAYN